MYIRSKKILCAAITAAMVLSTGGASVHADKSYDSTNVGIVSQVDEYIQNKGDRAVENLTGIPEKAEVVEVKEEKPAEKAPEKKPEPKKETAKYAQFKGKAVAVCETELNIRTEKNADAEVVGYLSRYGICDVKEKGDEWTLIESGSCKGYVRTQYLKFGDDAAKWYIDNGFSEVVTVNTETLTVRGDADINSECLTMVGMGESYDIVEKGKEWTKIQVTEDLQGFVNNKYIEIGYKTVKAVSIEEQQALAAEAEKQEDTAGAETGEKLDAEKDQNSESKDAAPDSNENGEKPETSDEATESEEDTESDNDETEDTSEDSEDDEEDEDDEESYDNEEYSDDEYDNEEDDDESDDDDDSSENDDSDDTSDESGYAAPAGQAGQDIANYALQFVGNPYVWGGTSLTEGADCSGFVQTIYADFGYSLSRCADDQVYDGTRVSLSELEPGDLLFYGDDSIGHVAIYIGGGQIVHAASSSQGIIVSSYDYHTPCAAVRIVNQ